MPSLLARLAILSLLLLGLAPLHAQQLGAWGLVEASPFHSYRFEDGSFLDPETGWIVNGDGEVFRTSDAGANWTRQATLPAYLRSVVFVSPARGFIGTLNRDNVLYETRDGGRSYVDISGRIAGPRPEGICGLWAVSDEVIYGAGWWASPAHFVATSDGGATWTSRDMSDYASSLVDVYFWDEQRGIAVGGTDGASVRGRAIVLLTEDGGETWSVQHTSSERGEWSWKITFPTPATGYVSVEEADGGRPAKVLKTTDAGVTWTELSIPGSNHLQGLGFITEAIGWASGRGTTTVTTDGGATWAEIALDGDINRFEFFGDTLAYAMGHRIYRYEAPRSSSADPDEVLPDMLAIEAAYPNPSTGAVTVPFVLDQASEVELMVYDMMGRRVAVLARGLHPAGAHEAVWDGAGASGRRAGPGGYVVQLTAGGRRVARTLLRTRPDR